MLQVIRTIAITAIAVGVSLADSNSLFVPVVMVILGALLLNISAALDKEVDK